MDDQVGKSLTSGDTPIGKCISGRGWKVAEKRRSSSGRPRSFSKSVSEKKEIEKRMRELKDVMKKIKEDKERSEAIRKERVRAAAERRREKDKRAEIVQKVSYTPILIRFRSPPLIDFVPNSVGICFKSQENGPQKTAGNSERE